MNLLTWNIQAGIGTASTRDYLFHLHRQMLQTTAKIAALRTIAQVIARYDVVCLQEIDLGGRRAGYRSQAEGIAAHSGHAHVAVQLNRVVPGISRHGNAIFSRWPMGNLRDLKLPGRFGGRGCLIADIAAPVPVTVACLHLSLGAADQTRQLAMIAAALRDAPAWLALGDFNCGANSAPMLRFCAQARGIVPDPAPATYPSWRPRHDYDHIVASLGLPLLNVRTEPMIASDHLALAGWVGGSQG